MLRDDEIRALPPKYRAAYSKDQQIEALHELMTALAMRVIPGAPDEAEIMRAIDALRIELDVLRAERDAIFNPSTSFTPISPEDVIQLREAVRELTGLIAATAAIGKMMDVATKIAKEFA